MIKQVTVGEEGDKCGEEVLLLLDTEIAKKKTEEIIPICITTEEANGKSTMAFMERHMPLPELNEVPMLSLIHI